MVGAHEFGAKRYLKFSTQMEHQYPERLGWQGKQNNGSHATLIILRLLPQADFAKPTTATAITGLKTRQKIQASNSSSKTIYKMKSPS